MSTYIIFFGKSQSFNFHAFDAAGLVTNFDAVIKNFDKLESDKFEPDNENNLPIISHYQFQNGNKRYSLLKMYGFAQAYDSSRIKGNSYGVALLSDLNIQITKPSLDLLTGVFKKFGELTLVNGKKFNASDFQEPAQLLWNAIVHHNSGNLLSTISTESFSNFVNSTKSFLVSDLNQDPIDIFRLFNSTSSLYFSCDQEHLKRAQKNNGKQVFPIYVKRGNDYQTLEEPSPQPANRNLPDDASVNLRRLESLVQDSYSQIEKITKEKELIVDQANKWKKRSYILSILIASMVIYLFANWIFEPSQTETRDPKEGPKKENTPLPYQTESILSDSIKREQLKNFITNLELYSKKPEFIYAEALIRDAIALKLVPDKIPFKNVLNAYEKNLENITKNLQKSESKRDSINSTKTAETADKIEQQLNVIEEDIKEKQEKIHQMDSTLKLLHSVKTN